MRLRAHLTLMTCLCAMSAATALAQPRPVIERIQPRSGPPGTAVEVIGRGMTADSNIVLGGSVLQVTSRMPNRWTVVVPPGAASGNLVLQSPRGSFSGPYFQVTAALPGPRADALEPAIGAPGTEVVIRGENFSARLSDNVVTLGSVPVVVRSCTPSSLTVIVPQGASSGPFRIRVTHAGEALSPPFTISQGTTITDFVPLAGPPGTEITIRGFGFGRQRRDVRVFLNNAAARVLRASDTEIVARLPNHATSGPLLVDIRGGGRAFSSTPFTIQYAPTVAGFTPPAAPPGAQVQITGTSFGTDVRAVQVTLAGRPVTVRSVTDRAITVELPQGSTAGPFEVRVHQLVAASAQPFMVLVPVAITGFQPRSGPPGTEVVITGAGFSPNVAHNAVTVSGVAAQVVSSTGSELRVRVPSTRSGPIVVAVQNNGSATTRGPFMLTQPPFIARFEPTSGPVGTTVTLHGANFGTNRALVRVSLDGRSVPVLSVSDDRVIVSIPQAAQSGLFSVEVRLQGGAASSAMFHVIGQAGAATIAPPTGFPGQQISVRGSGFPESGARVVFTGTGPVQPSSATPSELLVTVPVGARTGPVSVQLPGGRVVQVPTPFVVTEVPTGVGVSRIDATCARPGCRVTIHGHGFSPRATQNRVYFGERAVRVDRATATTLSLSLPNAPGSHPFRVDVRRVGIAESQAFTIAP